jgi:azurin
MSNQKRLFCLLAAFLMLIQGNAQPDADPDPPLTISLKAVGLQYDKVRFKVKPGAMVTVVLTNEDDMSHNLVFTQPGAREEVVNKALKMGAEGLEANFVPSSSKVLAYIPVIAPGQTASVTFSAPKEPGVYPFVCTFPGHGLVMYGAMYVTNSPMPPINDDPNIPPSRQGDAIAGSSSDGHQNHSEPVPQPEHPYPLIPPYLFRAFLPETGPDAIAVSLPQELSYCWDAGTCRLRYAWQGSFLDFSDFRKSYKKYAVKVAGTVFYRDKTAFPLRIDGPENIPAVKFKGYRLINRYPEFHYTINGMEVYELIHPKPDGAGLSRTFRIPKTRKPIWFAFSSEDGVDYSCAKGKWVDGKLKLSSGEAKEFTVIMTKKEGARL